MASGKHLGEFEIIVMAAVLRLGNDAYGVTIMDEIEVRSGRTVTVGALYATLTRLEDKSYLQVRMGEATAERGGRAKKYFSLTALGEEQFNLSVTVLSKMLWDLPGWNVGAPA